MYDFRPGSSPGVFSTYLKCNVKLNCNDEFNDSYHSAINKPIADGTESAGICKNLRESTGE